MITKVAYFNGMDGEISLVPKNAGQPPLDSTIVNYPEQTKYDYPEDLLPFIIGRKRHERKDSVTLTILRERQAFKLRLDEINAQKDILSKLNRTTFNKNKRKPKVESEFGIRGVSIHLTSSSSNWPVFQHVLPEIAFAGHSNCGKSTLVNVLAGLPPRKGPAAVSDRAGWTDQICFYQLCKRPPVMIMADLPGYGHAIASSKEKKQWKEMTMDYLSKRIVLSRCCVLVDCSRGLCKDDISLIKYLTNTNIPWQVVLTKADLLSLDNISKAIYLIESDLLDVFKIGSEKLWSTSETTISLNQSTNSKVEHSLIVPVSCSTGVGIPELWSNLLTCALLSTVPSGSKPELVINDSRVREHYNANLLKTQAYNHMVDKKINEKT
eukprot:gene20630-26747_t